MKLNYEVICIDEDNEKCIAIVSAGTEEGLMEEMGKGKWTDTIKRYQDEQKSPIREAYEDDEHDCKLGQDHGCDHESHKEGYNPEE